MKPSQPYHPKRLAPASVSSPPMGEAEAVGPTFSIYILPDGTETIPPADLERFPVMPLGDEKAAQAWLDWATEDAPAPKRKWGFWRDLAFYVALAALVLGVFLFRAAGGGAPVTFAGFSAMRVLTGSMQDVIPQGSLIITRSVDPATLEIGDDITYMAGEETTVTHRIVDITENFNGSGQRGFTTQGVMNDRPDEQKVPAANVVGKVIFHNLFLGEALAFVQANWTWLAVLLALCVAFIECLRVLARESREDKGKRPRPITGAHKK